LKLLGIDTATEMCSAALWLDGEVLFREAEVERGHADLILTMVDELLAESGCRLSALQAIAFGRGPGSFTGVRLAASVTQGLAFGAEVPVVPVSDLRAVAQRCALETAKNGIAVQRVLVCNDARMKEVYWGCFESEGGGVDLMRAVTKENVTRPDAVSLPDAWAEAERNANASSNVYGAGRGFQAYPELQNRLGARLRAVDAQILPRAREVVVLAVAEVAAGRTLSPEDAIPTYLRDDVARPKS
jgi:tRNA threonylcarbamoyladenosine biosynthesis protein TsaB